jgi:hypothetical protein
LVIRQAQKDLRSTIVSALHIGEARLIVEAGGAKINDLDLV